MKYRILKIGSYFRVQYRFCFIWFDVKEINRNKDFDCVYRALKRYESEQEQECLWERVKAASICDDTASEK